MQQVSLDPPRENDENDGLRSNLHEYDTSPPNEPYMKFEVNQVQNDYVEYYQRVKSFGKMKNWTQAKISEMLKDQEGFEKQYKKYVDYMKRVQTGKSDPLNPTVEKIYKAGMVRKQRLECDKYNKEMAELEESLK